MHEATAAVESSLNSLLSASIFFFLWRNSSYLSLPGPNKHLASHTAQPGSLFQESCSRPRTPTVGFSHPAPRAGPRDLIVLKHSSYYLIFQCPLSLVSDLHIFWNTIGWSLCLSDQLGISLVSRGSGLRSHLSHCHLRNYHFQKNFPWYHHLQGWV